MSEFKPRFQKEKGLPGGSAFQAKRALSANDFPARENSISERGSIELAIPGPLVPE